MQSEADDVSYIIHIGTVSMYLGSRQICSHIFILLDVRGAVGIEGEIERDKWITQILFSFLAILLSKEMYRQRVRNGTAHITSSMFHVPCFILYGSMFYGFAWFVCFLIV